MSFRRTQRVVLLSFLAALVSFPSVAAEPSPLGRLDATYQELESKYPASRQWWAGVELASGLATVGASTSLFFKSNLNWDEQLIQWVGLGLGSGLALDGLTSLINPTAMEYIIPHYKNMPRAGAQKEYGDKDRLQYGREELKYYASEARNIRLARSGLYFLTGLGYLCLYSKGSHDYKTLVYPGLAFTGMAAFYLLFSSPEERAWDEYSAGDPRKAVTNQVHLFASALASGAVLGASASF
jgi:hypothetical protein